MAMSCGGEKDPEVAKQMRDMLGPGQADHMFRQALQVCWMLLPDGQKTIDEVEKQARRMMERALADLREDAAAFGLDKSTGLES